MLLCRAKSPKCFACCAFFNPAACLYRHLYLYFSSFCALVRVLNQIERTHLIILDDFGLQPLDATTRIALLQILEDRYGKQAVMITSQLPVAQWHDVIGEPTIADGIMDRLVGNAHRLELKGESMRRKKLDKIV